MKIFKVHARAKIFRILIFWPRIRNQHLKMHLKTGGDKEFQIKVPKPARLLTMSTDNSSMAKVHSIFNWRGKLFTASRVKFSSTYNLIC